MGREERFLVVSMGAEARAGPEPDTRYRGTVRTPYPGRAQPAPQSRVPFGVAHGRWPLARMISSP